MDMLPCRPILYDLRVYGRLGWFDRLHLVYSSGIETTAPKVEMSERGGLERSGGTRMGQTQEQILTTGEAAALCGVSRSTLRRAVAQGHLQAWHTPGKHLRFARSACLEFARSLGRVDLVGQPYGREVAITPAPEPAPGAASARA
jgi:excisionase family DNA binding protein